MTLAATQLPFEMNPAENIFPNLSRRTLITPHPYCTRLEKCIAD
jgi:hypothetical protein